MYKRNFRSNQKQLKQRGCYFCINQIAEIDYKEGIKLARFTSSYAKILPRRKTGTCSRHQRKLARAIKRARIVGLLPFVKR